MSPQGITKTLNAEGIPGPSGRDWRDTTIRGQIDQGTGILNNSLYVVRIEWNRCSYVKDPRSGKRVARPNPKDL
jgi:site-specific DNA recombinase